MYYYVEENHPIIVHPATWLVSVCLCNCRLKGATAAGMSAMNIVKITPSIVPKSKGAQLSVFTVTAGQASGIGQVKVQE